LTTAPIILLQCGNGLVLDLLFDGLFLCGSEILSFGLLEASLDGEMKAVIQDAVVSGRSG
jgi:hypothetical protein